MKHKKLNDFTIAEWKQYLEIIQSGAGFENDLLYLFGYNVEELSISEYQAALSRCLSDRVDVVKIKTKYKVGKYELQPVLDFAKLKAGQFVDYNSYLPGQKLEEILSVFLLPVKRDFYFFRTTCKYGNGYNILDLQKELLEHFTISEALSLSNFFFRYSLVRLRVTKDYLEKKTRKMEYKFLMKQKVD
jgi:hypothetical protein